MGTVLRTLEDMGIISDISQMISESVMAGQSECTTQPVEKHIADELERMGYTVNSFNDKIIISW